MAWVKMPQELGRHPKLKRFARRLGIPEPDAIGHLFLLWGWAMSFAQDGDLSSYSAEDIADAMLWEGDEDELLEALLNCGGEGGCGFLEQVEECGLVIAGWDNICGGWGE